jgi:hypothetical protein
MAFVKFVPTEGTRTIPTQELPGWEEAWIPKAKLVDYALNALHEEGQHKAHMFRVELGIEQQDWQFLRDQILGGFPGAEATFREENAYGLTWEVPILIVGQNEAVRWVTTGWIVEYRHPRPKLTTAYLKQSEPNKGLRLLESQLQSSGLDNVRGNRRSGGLVT